MSESEPDPDSVRRIEDAFDGYLRCIDREGEEAARLFLERQPDELRGELLDLARDYRQLQRNLGGGPGGLGPGRCVGQYRLLRELGRGGMGVVFEAEDLKLERRVAVKLLFPIYALSERALARFREEASIGGRLSHRSIVGVHDVGEDEGVHYIVQELVSGGRSLADEIGELRRADRLPPDHPRRTAEFFAEVAEAVARAHADGVVHRDLKPSNLLVAADGSPRIADFGLSPLSEVAPESGSGLLAGTLHYMSPEQARGHPGAAGELSDVFSLGATLYEALTLVRPFEGDTPQQILESVCTREPLDPRRIRSHTPRDLAVICLRALEKKPAQRFASMAELAADLRRHLADEPIRARPPGSVQVLVKWCRRHKAIASTGAAVLVALVAVSALWIENQAARRGTEAVLDISLQLVRFLNPQVPRSADVEEVLARTTRVARESFAERPGLRARILASVGFVHQIDGRYALAEEVLAEALAVFEDSDASEAETLSTGSALARVLIDRRRFGEAEELLARMTALATRVGAPILQDLRFDLLSLVLQSRDAGRLERLELFEEGHRTAGELLRGRLLEEEARGGTRSPRALETRFALGLYQDLVGRPEEAERELQRVHMSLRRLVPDDHPMVFQVQDALARFHRRQGRATDAYRLLDALLARIERVARPDEQLRLRCTLELAWICLDQRKLERAAELFERAEELAAGREEASHLLARRGRALTLESWGELEAALGLLEETRERASGMPSVAESDLLALRRDIAWALFLLGRTAESIALLEQLLEIAASQAAPERLEEAGTRKLYALVLLRAGRAEEAISAQRRALDALSELFGAHAPYALVTLDRLGCMLAGADRKPEAIELARGALAGLDPESPFGDLLRGRLATWQGRGAETEGQVGSSSPGRASHSDPTALAAVRLARAAHGTGPELAKGDELVSIKAAGSAMIQVALARESLPREWPVERLLARELMRTLEKEMRQRDPTRWDGTDDER